MMGILRSRVSGCAFVLSCALLAAAATSVAAPQDAAPQDDPAAAATPTEAEAGDAADTPADPAGAAGDDVADETLEPIVLPRQQIFLEDVDLDQVDPNILETQPDAETPEQKLRRLFVMYMDAIADRGFEEADTLGKQIVELTISEYGLDSHESAKALTNLAIAQHGIQDYESSILNYTAAIGIIERVDDRLSSALINPLRGLGAAQLASGRPDLAREAYDRAVHVSHVNEGPHNLEQIEVLQSLAETYLAVGEAEEAADIQKRIFYLQARNVDDQSLDMIPALKTRAEWQRRMLLLEQERYTWRRIIGILEDEYGKESLELIEPLTELAKSYLIVGYLTDAPYVDSSTVASGEIYLKRAVRITERNEEAGWQDRMAALLQLGDYYMVTDRANRGHRVYREVWDLLSEEPDRLPVRARELEQATPLNEIRPPRMFGGDPSVPIVSDPPGYDTATVTVGYSVSTRGQAADIRVVDADPPGLSDMYESVGREIRRCIWRPKMVDGEFVDAPDLTFNHQFYYRRADLPEPVQEPAEDELVSGNPNSG
ncbi:MAG: tetratricopeptide repeat protein [Gammaproteobacteria bacterium]|nr:tetratricopeptide repeat protein [Gammaproteobacteria bacterium]MDH4253063.1 tetratricopeptide repeat protein [Gammaproteobacteria bacterium]MDH5311228.1 tetratricopeptide repeat protein [Gammaproteobacteria bacterium]